MTFAPGDTTSAVASLQQALLMRRSGEERLRMAADMFDAGRALVIAGVTAGSPMSREEIRAAVFLRTYGEDFDPHTRTRILACLRV